MARVPRLPRPGEALLATSMTHVAGGKGFNQAVAARRLGAEVAMAGAVGEDAFGDDFCRLLDGLGIDRTHVARSGAPTGLAIPVVERGGENFIVVALGANLEAAAVPAAFIAGSDMLLLQGEVALATNLEAIERARTLGVRVLLNVAPADPRLEPALPLASCVVVNELEERDLGGAARVRAGGWSAGGHHAG